jgi:hypothetical protein
MIILSVIRHVFVNHIHSEVPVKILDVMYSLKLL